MRHIILILLLLNFVYADENHGASFKEGKGIEISDATKASLGIKTLEFNENTSVIPQSAILSTIEGDFVYVANGKYFIRTEVKMDKLNEEVKITSGLYAGDELVTAAVKYLWYAELQAIRGGVSCADGH